MGSFRSTICVGYLIFSLQTIQKYKSLGGMEDRDAEHKYVEYCLQLRGYGEEQLRARNADEEDCHIASSCYGIIIVNNNEKLHSSYKWDRVLTIAGKVSFYFSTTFIKIIF